MPGEVVRKIREFDYMITGAARPRTRYRCELWVVRIDSDGYDYEDRCGGRIILTERNRMVCERCVQPAVLALSGDLQHVARRELAE